jgi:phage tail-like protein
VTAPADALELLIPDAPGGALWIACRLSGDGARSPAIRQARVEYGHEGWLRSLPAIYQRADDGSHFLSRALALFESTLETESRLVDALPTLFDPAAASDAGAPGGWLDWLAGWLDVELDERWSSETRRHAVAEAFALHGQRGTRAGLRRMVELYAGVRALIHEPANDAVLWSLGERSVLDFTTQLAPEEAQGAVVGTSAVMDESHLISDDAFGAPLVEDLAHRFCVQLYGSDVHDGETLADVRRVLDREKPAHTTYHLCTIEPRSLLGFQARLGIDAIVGGPLADLVLDSPRQLDRDAVLPDAPPGPPAARRLGDDTRLGWRSTLV